MKGVWNKILRVDLTNGTTETEQLPDEVYEKFLGGAAAVGYLTESMHGAGSPQAQMIMISRLMNMEEKKKAAKRLCGIVGEE